MILGRGQRERALAVAENEEARLFARQEFLDHQLGAGFAQAAAEDHLDGALCFRERLCATTTPLPAARPSALITIGAPCSRAVGFGRRDRVEALVGGGRDVVRAAQVLGEAFGPFKPGRCLCGSERLDAGAFKIIDEAGG